VVRYGAPALVAQEDDASLAVQFGSRKKLIGTSLTFSRPLRDCSCHTVMADLFLPSAVPNRPTEKS
jgi:hypothetical protein